MLIRISIAAVLLVGFTIALSRGVLYTPSDKRRPAAKPAAVDERLQSIASAALGQREGAIVVLDPETGQGRAIVNPKLAFESAFTPGSTIKPFTTLAALRTGTIAPDTPLRCNGKYKREDVVDACSHPANLGPFNPAKALAYSCNYYFATVGERLEEEPVARLLADFGFGQKTGITDAEATGTLARGRWQPESAIGEGPFLQVTPIQMATAYAALFNGGRLLKPSLTDVSAPRVRAQLQIDNKERDLLREGMRGAVTFGTAAEAKLATLPFYLVGKTGTSTPLQGFRSQGWFAGLAFTSETDTNATLVVVVYLKNAHGSDAAEIARPIFEDFANQAQRDSTYVSVHQVSDNSTQQMALENYVLGVVSTEASIENEPEALKAQAIASRTYALKNLGRHHEHGYDFCSTTHCQRFELIAARPALAEAVKQTAGLILRDPQDEIVDAYFSASCGGNTANLKTLWGEEAPTYLHGVNDDYCNSGSHYRWTDTISAERLASALRSDPRTDVGQTVRSLRVSRQDKTGRAEMISIEGDRARTISGWEFKLIIGRSLGWNVLKSSRFNVLRSGSQFVFRGGGFGHGLGLCQEGSHSMAQRGFSYQQILAHYFPSTNVVSCEGRLGVRCLGTALVLNQAATPILDQSGAKAPHSKEALNLSASNFRVTFPKTIQRNEAEQVLRLLESSRADLVRRVAAAGIQPRFPDLEIVINETTGDFVSRTGMPPWAAAATKNNRVELQPLKLLKQRRILETTLRHELVHVMIAAISGRQTPPRWFTEGMAIHVAGEGQLFAGQTPINTPSAIEQALANSKSAAEMRTAYTAAYNLVAQMIRSEGEDKVWKKLADRS